LKLFATCIAYAICLSFWSFAFVKEALPPSTLAPIGALLTLSTSAVLFIIFRRYQIEFKNLRATDPELANTSNPKGIQGLQRLLVIFVLGNLYGNWSLAHEPAQIRILANAVSLFLIGSLVYAIRKAKARQNNSPPGLPPL